MWHLAFNLLKDNILPAFYNDFTSNCFLILNKDNQVFEIF